MATHDYVISNGTGSAVRSDLNGALAAIVSQNSNASAPATTYAYMSWADTSAGVMKMRNGANSAWISLYELDGTFLASDISLAAGSAAAPSLFFTGDTNTGLFSPGADTVALATAGSNRLHISSGGLVGIGTTSPGYLLDIQSTSATLRIRNTTAPATGGTSSLLFEGLNNFSAASQSYINNIQAGNSGATQLTFGTSGTVDATATERLRITSAGNVGIGTTAPNRKLEVSDASADNFIRVNTTGATKSGIEFASGGTVYSQLYFNNVSPYDLSLLQQYTTGSLILGTNSTERARIDSSGRLLVGTSTDGGAGGLTIYPIGSGAGSAAIGVWNKTNTALEAAAQFRVSATTIGSISYSNTLVAYNTTSDYRLKENVIAVTNGIARLQQLKPSRFNFKVDPNHTVEGFIAHEAQAVVPECVTGTRDAVDADGNPVYQGIDQSKLVPLLTAALQEAIAKIEALEADVAALKGA